MLQEPCLTVADVAEAGFPAAQQSGSGQPVSPRRSRAFLLRSALLRLPKLASQTCQLGGTIALGGSALREELQNHITMKSIVAVGTLRSVPNRGQPAYSRRCRPAARFPSRAHPR